MTYTTRQTCRLCSHDALRQVLELPATPLANSYPSSLATPCEHYPLRVVQCEACGHVQCPVVVDPELMFSEYAYTTGNAASMRQHVGKLADEVSGLGRFLVDIGSNDGLLLSEAQKRGMLAIGVDPARNLAAEATAKGRLTLPGYLTPALAQQLRNIIGKPCTVTALNVFAHADDLSQIAEAVRILIHPSETFVFEVAYLLDVLDKNEVGSLYHEHVSHHHVGPLVGFFRQHGLGLFRVDRVDSQGGSLRCFVRVKGIPGPGVTELMHAEREVVPGLLAKWPARVALEQATLMAQIADYAGRGLAVYGAPARLTPWAYAMGLRTGDVSCVFDDEPRKVGRYTPGLKWPIVPSSELMARNPPAVLVASWNYLDSIRRRFQDYQGQWLTPPGRT